MALRQRDGAEVWRNDKLKRRGLSTPVVTSTAIAVADYQGYLHWLDKNTGELVARERIAKKQRVSNPPAGAGDTVVVLDRRRHAGGVSEPTSARCPRRAAATGDRRHRASRDAANAAPAETPAPATPPAATPPPATPPAATPPPTPYTLRQCCR